MAHWYVNPMPVGLTAVAALTSIVQKAGADAGNAKTAI